LMWICKQYGEDEDNGCLTRQFEIKIKKKE
jgi:hypothetical protein